MSNAYRKFAGELEVPGFRKGKIPRSMIDTYVGGERIRLEALRNGLPELYVKGVEDSGIFPVSEPEIRIVRLEEEGDVIFEAKVEVKPPVEVKDYVGIEVERPSDEVTEEELGSALDDIRDKFATLEPVEGKAVENGDYVMFDYKVFTDGIPLEGKSGSDVMIGVGSEDFLPGFDEQIIGARKGDILDIVISFPPTYEVQELAGKPATFRTIIKEVKRKVLPPLEDSLAREVGNYNTLAELKDDLRMRIAEAKKSYADKVVHDRVLKALVDRTYIDLPEKMVNEQIQREVERIEETLRERGIELDDYLKAVKGTRYGLEQSIRPDVIEAIKEELILDAVAKLEGIEVSEEEAFEYLKEVARATGGDQEKLIKEAKERGRIPYITEQLRLSKALDFLVSNARVKGANAITPSDQSQVMQEKGTQEEKKNFEAPEVESEQERITVEDKAEERKENSKSEDEPDSTSGDLAD